MASKETTEGRLREALQRLVERRPVRVKLKGRLTLNKINKMSDFMAGYSVKSKVIGAISGNFNGPISLMAILGLRL